MKHISLCILLISILAFTYSCQSEESGIQEDLSGQYQATWQLVDSFTYKLDTPKHLYRGHPWVFGGRFIYNHQFKSEILEFDKSGKLLHQMGRTGSGPGEFGETSLCIGDDSLLIVLDKHLYRVQMFGKDGEWLGQNPMSSGTEENPFSFYSAFGEIHYCGNGEFVTNIGSRIYGPGQHDEFYELPYFARFDTTGYMLAGLGKWDSVYIKKKFLDYLDNIQFTFDKYSDHFFSTQEATSNISEYDKEGRDISHFGFAGKHITGAKLVSLPRNFSEKSPPMTDFDLYQDIHTTKDHIIRFYRTAKPGENYRLSMPYYCQVYDRNGNLLADDKAPANFFLIRGQGLEDRSFWVMQKRNYDEEAYSHKIYKYQLVVAKK